MSMSIELDPITSGFNLSKINNNFDKVENELNNNVLRRNGLAIGETNHMEVNLDMNSFAILNAFVNGVSLDDIIDRLLSLESLAEDLEDILNLILAGGGFNVAVPVMSFNDLRFLNPVADKQTFYLSGYYNDGKYTGGGFFYYDELAIDPDNGGTVAVTSTNKRIIRSVNNKVLDVYMFGAKGDGTSNDTIAIQNAINVATSTQQELRVPAGLYKIMNTLTATNTLTLKGESQAFYLGAKFICGTAGMTLFDIQGPENWIENIVCVGFESNLEDAVNGYGQISTCTAYNFVRGDGSTDLDSHLVDCNITAFLTGVYAEGANLRFDNGIFTACKFPIRLRYSASAPNDFRGHTIDGTRFHKCGGNGYTTDSVCIQTTGIFKNSKITNVLVDAGNVKFYVGSLAEGSVIQGIVCRYATDDLITVINTGITPSVAFQHYQISDISFETPTGTPALAGGWAVKLIDAPSGNLSNINSTHTRKGIISLTNSNETIIEAVYARNMNITFATTPDVDAIELINSTDIQISNVFVRNTLDASQARSVINTDTSSSCNVRQISFINVVNFSFGGGPITGERYNARSAPSITYGTAIPVTGSYRTGSMHINTSAVVGGPGIWICITAGAPGAWRPLLLELNN